MRETDEEIDKYKEKVREGGRHELRKGENDFLCAVCFAKLSLSLTG
jgi:hypothetical protein